MLTLVILDPSHQFEVGDLAILVRCLEQTEKGPIWINRAALLVDRTDNQSHDLTGIPVVREAAAPQIVVPVPSNDG